MGQIAASYPTGKNGFPSINKWLGEKQHCEIKIGHSIALTKIRKLKPHDHLFSPDQSQANIYQVVEGVVARYKVLADGRRQIVSFYYPGDLIGVEVAGKWQHYGEALCHSRVRCIPTNIVDRLICEDAEFGRALVKTLATELSETQDQMLSLGCKSAQERLATFLLRIARRYQREGKDGSSLSIPMTRSDIADYLGLTVETVSRNFTKLKSKEIIRLDGSSNVHILNMSLLREIASGQ